MRSDQPCEPVAGAARAGGDGLGGLDEALDAAEADELERHLLGGEVVVEARLADAEHVGDVLRRRPVEAALGEHAARRRR